MAPGRVAGGRGGKLTSKQILTPGPQLAGCPPTCTACPPPRDMAPPCPVPFPCPHSALAACAGFSVPTCRPRARAPHWMSPVSGGCRALSQPPPAQNLPSVPRSGGLCFFALQVGRPGPGQDSLFCLVSRHSHTCRRPPSPASE